MLLSMELCVSRMGQIESVPVQANVGGSAPSSHSHHQYLQPQSSCPVLDYKTTTHSVKRDEPV